jgi:hypothetical protein
MVYPAASGDRFLTSYYDQCPPDEKGKERRATRQAEQANVMVDQNVV